MANRYFTQFIASLAKTPVFLFGSVTFGASGAPTLDAVNSKGIKSIVRNSAGNYTVNLGTTLAVDVYPRIFNVKGIFVKASGTPAAPLFYLVSHQVSNATAPSFIIQFLAVDGVTATDPASGEVFRFGIDLTNSTAP